MPTLQHAITTNLAKYQWYTHFSRTEGHDIAVIKQVMKHPLTDIGLEKFVADYKKAFGG